MNRKAPRTSIVVPFKNPSGSKQRLAELLSADARRELALILFEETIASLKNAVALTGVDHTIMVVTDSEEICALAEKLGATYLLESEAHGETSAVTAATARSIELGFGRQVVIPADMAMLDPAEVAMLLEITLAEPYAVLCPAVNDDGTNAVMSSPPDALSFRFGNASFPDYVMKAKDRKLNLLVLRLKSLVLDVDTSEDIEMMLRDFPDSRATKFVRRALDSNSRENIY